MNFTELVSFINIIDFIHSLGISNRVRTTSLFGQSQMGLLTRLAYVFLCLLSAGICLSGYILFLYSWKPFISAAMFIIGITVALVMTKRLLEELSNNDDE